MLSTHNLSHLISAMPADVAESASQIIIFVDAHAIVLKSREPVSGTIASGDALRLIISAVVADARDEAARLLHERDEARAEVAALRSVRDDLITRR